MDTLFWTIILIPTLLLDEIHVSTTLKKWIAHKVTRLHEFHAIKECVLERVLATRKFDYSCCWWTLCGDPHARGITSQNNLLKQIVTQSLMHLLYVAFFFQIVSIWYSSVQKHSLLSLKAWHSYTGFTLLLDDFGVKGLHSFATFMVHYLYK